MAKHRFQKGNKFGKHGRQNPPGGRPPDWFRAKMRAIASDKEAVNFLTNCVNGNEVEPIVSLAGKVVKVPSKATVRLEAWKEAADRGYGKAVQAHQMLDQEGKPVGINFFSMPAQTEGEEGKTG